jgi:hypothetical protein
MIKCAIFLLNPVCGAASALRFPPVSTVAIQIKAHLGFLCCFPERKEVWIGFREAASCLAVTRV